jgi:hypothetical protein
MIDIAKVGSPEFEIQSAKLGRVLCRCGRLSVRAYLKLIAISPAKNRIADDFARALFSVTSSLVSADGASTALASAQASSLSDQELREFSQLYLERNVWLRKIADAGEPDVAGEQKSPTDKLTTAFERYESTLNSKLRTMGSRATDRMHGTLAALEQQYGKMFSSLRIPFTDPSISAVSEILKRNTTISDAARQTMQAAEVFRNSGISRAIEAESAILKHTAPFSATAEAIRAMGNIERASSPTATLLNPAKFRAIVEPLPNPIHETNRKLEEMTAGIEALQSAVGQSTDRALADADAKSKAVGRQGSKMILATWAAVVAAVVSAIISIFQVQYGRQSSIGSAALTGAIVKLNQDEAQRAERTDSLLSKLIDLQTARRPDEASAEGQHRPVRANKRMPR